jgi:hypothetical protein
MEFARPAHPVSSLSPKGDREHTESVA